MVAADGWRWEKKIMMRHLIFTIYIIAACAVDCNVVKDFGAACDGTADDSQQIQRALNECNNGRYVIFPSDRTCLSQPLTLPSRDAWLVFEPNATLKAGSKWTTGQSFISASGATNVSITGPGTFDGSGAQWWTGSNKTPNRPKLLELQNCTHVWLEGFTILNPAAWSTSLSGADFGIHNISIRSPNYLIAPNTDGIDLAVDGAHISNADIKNGDDSICMKSPARNILVENSTVRQGNGLVVGTSDHADFANITFRNCTAIGTLFGAHIKFKDAQVGHVDGVRFENIHIVDPWSYAIGINQNGQSMMGGEADDAAGHLLC